MRLQLPPITLTVFLWLLTTTVVAEESVAPPTFVKTWGQEGSGNGEFEFPIRIAIHEQTIFVTDHYNNRVQIFDKQGTFLAKFGEYGIQPGQFGGKFIVSKDKVANLEGPIGITVDPHDHIWVASINGRIQQFDTNGKLLGGLQSGQGSEPGKFSAPHTLAFNSRGDLFIVDSFNQRIQKFAMK